MTASKKVVHVTRPSLPPIDEFVDSIKEIWKSGWITNGGAFHNELEGALQAHLGVNQVSLFSNGTLALITALQALELKGEVITTPFSFVATSHALWWNKITPVFVDIESKSGNMDPAKIEAAITDKTTAILPVHVYGNPCDHKAIRAIADKHGLKLIYDAAHAFGVEQDGESILNYGDMSILSFHATKVFNTIEGGAIVCQNKEMKTRIDRLKNFGFVDELTVAEPGINAKMNEVQAAYGLLQLKSINEEIATCKKNAEYYRDCLSGVKGISIWQATDSVKYNYSYMPILVEDDYPLGRDGLYELLRSHKVFARRYFHPLISSFEPYSKLPSSNSENLPVATSVANRVLCLPIYHSLTKSEIQLITDIIKEGQS